MCFKKYIITILAGGMFFLPQISNAQNCAVNPSVNFHITGPTNLFGCGGPPLSGLKLNESGINIRVSGGEFCSLGKKARIRVNGIPGSWDININGQGWNRKGSQQIDVDVSQTQPGRIQVRALRSSSGYFSNSTRTVTIERLSPGSNEYLNGSDYAHYGQGSGLVFKGNHAPSWTFTHIYFRNCS